MLWNRDNGHILLQVKEAIYLMNRQIYQTLIDTTLVTYFNKVFKLSLLEYLEAKAGIEPANRGFAVHGITILLLGHFLKIC